MSRTFKKTPGFTDHTNKSAKRLANKKVRKDWAISNGANYKRKFESYEIKDWKSLFFNDKQLCDYVKNEKDFLSSSREIACRFRLTKK